MYPWQLMSYAAIIMATILVWSSHRQTRDEGWSHDTARALMVAHQTATNYMIGNPGVTGSLPALTASSVTTMASFPSCAASKLVLTYYSGTVRNATPAQVLTAVQARGWGYPNYGVSTGAASITTPDGRTVALPCAPPAGAPFLFTQFKP